MGYLSYIGWAVGTAYIYKFLNNIYSVYSHVACLDSQPDSECMSPLHDLGGKNYTLEMYSSEKRGWNRKNAILVYEKRDMNLAESFEEEIEVKLPNSTRANGTAYAHVFLYTKNCKKPRRTKTTKCSIYTRGAFTLYKAIKSEEHFLLDSLTTDNAKETIKKEAEIRTH